MNTITADRPVSVTPAAVQTRSLNLTTAGVSKQYTATAWGLRDFTLDLGPGVLGLLGPNGAGKSTLMRILATITKATAGRVAWNGIDIARSPDDLRAVLGYLPQDFGVYPHLTATEFLEYLAAIKGLSATEARTRIDELLQVVILCIKVADGAAHLRESNDEIKMYPMGE